MADIPNRAQLERKIARLLGKYNQQQLGELLKMMGNSPSMAKIPPSFWTESEQALAAELVPFSEEVYVQAAQRVIDSVPLPIGFDWTLVNQDAADWAVRDVGRLVTKITDTTRKRIGNAVSSYFTEAQTIGDLEMRLSRMKDRFGNILGPVRAEMISVTEITRAATQGELGVARQLKNEGIDMRKVWQTHKDDLVCAICAPLQGVEESVWRSVAPDGPPAHVRCLPGDSLILPIGDVAAGSKRWYEGNVIAIETLENKLTVTPNHPILTPGGWVAAGLLQQGDNIFSYNSIDWKSSPIKINEKHGISSIKDMFGSFGIFGFRMPTAAPDFHGDGANSEIAIIRPNSKVLNKTNSDFTQPISKNELIFSNVISEVSLPGLCPHGKLFSSDFSPSSNIMGSFDLAPALLNRHLFPFESFSIGSGTGGYSSIEQASSESTPINPSFLSQLIFGFSGKITTQQIVKIRNDYFSGHVYNLQTSSGLYVADGIVTHNCRCFLSLLLPKVTA